MLANISQLPTYVELQRMSRFCVALFRRDRIILSAYVASNLFEMIIDLWLEMQDTPYSEKNNLVDKIYKVDLDMFEVSRSSLTQYRLTRNDIVHGYIHALDSYKVRELILFIWAVLDDKTFFKNNKSIDNIDLTTAYYWIRDFEALDTKSLEKKTVKVTSIEKEDFNDLYKMADKFQSLSQYISTNKRLGKYNLTVDNISKVNSTSAYIWLAVTPGNFNGRQKIESSSVSILATPNNIRIYIDFGGLAFNERKEYYRYIRETKTDDLQIDDFKDIFIFNIEWYSYIENRLSIEILNSEDKEKLVSIALNKLAKHSQEVPIAWNRLLIGYVLQKQNLSFEKLWDSLNNIITIYNKFQTFNTSYQENQELITNKNTDTLAVMTEDLSKHFS